MHEFLIENAVVADALETLARPAPCLHGRQELGEVQVEEAQLLEAHGVAARREDVEARVRPRRARKDHGRRGELDARG